MRGSRTIRAGRRRYREPVTPCALAPVLPPPPRSDRQTAGGPLRLRESRRGAKAPVSEINAKANVGHRLHRQAKRLMLKSLPLGSRYSTLKIVQGRFVDSLRCARNFANVRPESSESE
jgi:hypothetical protein